MTDSKPFETAEQQRLREGVGSAHLDENPKFRGAAPRAILTFPAEISKEDADRIRQQFHDALDPQPVMIIETAGEVLPAVSAQPKGDRKVPDMHAAGEAFIDDVIGCARCHGDGHQELTWRPLTHPIDYGDGTIATYWALCPTTFEPILLSHFESSVKDAWDAEIGARFHKLGAGEMLVLTMNENTELDQDYVDRLAEVTKADTWPDGAGLLLLHDGAEVLRIGPKDGE